jgi:hypothetical protein
MERENWVLMEKVGILKIRKLYVLVFEKSE